MERVRRRWWTSLISLVAGLLVFTAVASGVFQIAVLMVPSYRTQLSEWVSTVAGRPVDIGGINLLWRGLTPQIELSDIVLRDPGTDDGIDNSLSADRLRLGFSLTHLLRGDLLPDRVLLSGLQLTVDIDAERRVRVAGFRSGPLPVSGGAEGWRTALARFSVFMLSDAQIRVRHPRWGDQSLDLAVGEASLVQTGDGFNVSASGALPAALGGAFEARAEVRGESDRISRWSGRWQISAEGLVPAGWALPGLQYPLPMTADGLWGTAVGQFVDGHLQWVELQAEATALQATPDDQRVAADAVSVRMEWQPGPAGGMVSLTDLSSAGQSRAALRLRWGEDSVELDAPHLDLDALAPWLALAADAEVAQLAGLRGQLDALHLRGSAAGGDRDWRYTVESGLTEAGWQPRDGPVKLAGLNGRLVATEHGGRFSPDPDGWQLALPAQWSQPLRFDRFAGDLLWERLAETDAAAAQWRVRAPALDWTAAGAAGQGRAVLDLGGEAGPALTLDLQLQVADLAALKPYLPARWPDPLERWVSRALVSGRVSDAVLRIDGPLRDFPFGARPTGTWRLELPIRDSELAFSPDWPALKDFDADLVFEGNALQISGRRGRLLQVPVLGLEARIPALHLGALTIESRTEADLDALFAVVRASSLRRRLAPLLEAGTARGRAALDLQLGIPLNDVRSLTVDGHLGLDDIEWALAALPAPVEALTGDLHFTRSMIAAESLQARLLDTPLQARVVPADDHPGDLEVSATVPVASRLASAFLPSGLRAHLDGESVWQARMPLGVAAAPLQLDSELRGTAIRLPAPLGKPLDERLPLHLRLARDGDDWSVGVQAGGDRISAQLRLPPADDPASAPAVEIHFGQAAPRPAENVRGVFIGGRLSQLDLGQWAALLGPADAPPGGLRGIALEVGRLRFGGFSLADQSLQLQPDTGGYRLTLQGAAEGLLAWDTDRTVMSATLSRLALGFEGLTMQGDIAAETPADADTLLRPDRWPAVVAHVDALSLNGLSLGQARLRTAHLDDGIALERFRLDGGQLTGEVSGEWRRTDTLGRATLDFDLQSPAVEPTLRAFGFAPNLTAEQTRVQGQLVWQETPLSLDWTRAEGPVTLSVRDGTLRAIEPGAGRVLGLMSFYALPRRLTLDFSDVVDDGLRFDRIDARFVLADGIARSDDLEIRGPSLRMEIEGSIDLAGRRLDQRVRVLPGLSGGVTLGATLLGGPAAGAIMLLAQELLEKPLDQVTQFGYRVQGSWDNPQVTPLDLRDDSAGEAGMQ